MEIITGIERRRRWSAEEKLRIVAETERADGGIAEIARRCEISRGRNWRSQVRLPGSVRFNCTPDLATSVKVRIRLLMLAFWDIGVRASEGPASGFCLLARYALEARGGFRSFENCRSKARSYQHANQALGVRPPPSPPYPRGPVRPGPAPSLQTLQMGPALHDRGAIQPRWPRH